MSYIECKSFVTGKTVQYGLIDVELKHKVLNESITVNCPYINAYWNTAPGTVISGTSIKFDENEKFWRTSGVYTKGLTGRKIQGYSASGVLESEYGYVHRGKNPVISRQVIKVDDLNYGLNTYDLFETTNNKVILEVVKLKSTELETFFGYDDAYEDINGDVVSDPDLICSVRIVQILKTNEKVISEYEILRNDYEPVSYPVEFVINSEIFRIKNFNPNYATDFSYDYRYNMYLDYIAPSKTGNKLYVEGEISEEPGDFVGMEFSMLATEYWSGVVISGPDTLKYHKIVKTDGSSLSDQEKLDLGTQAIKGWLLNNVDTNPDTFIQFSTGYGLHGHDWAPNYEGHEYAEELLNGDKSLKIVSYNEEIETIFNRFNYTFSPVIIPYVDSNYEMVSRAVDNGIYIPLTNTIFEGEPDPEPDPDPEPEPETVEPADDPRTIYIPVLPDDVLPGIETYEYPSGDVINGDPAAYNLYRPSYSNYVFKRYYKSSTEFDNTSAWEFINDCNNCSMSEPFHTLFKLVTGHPQLGELVARVYELPFEYDEIINTSALIQNATIIYGYVGFVTVGFNNDGTYDSNDVHWYHRIPVRFIPLDLGGLYLQKVFNNYLDYTETRYKLNLPYGGGVLELDPNMLFDYGRVTAVISIKGYLDIDTGFLVMKVLLNGQLYYETSVNVASDRLATVSDSVAVPVTLTKMIGGVSIGSQVGSLLSSEARNAMRMSSMEREYEIRKDYRKDVEENITREVNARVDHAVEQQKRLLNYRREGDR